MIDEFSSVFDLYKDDVYRLIYSYTLNKHDSEDILQNTFIKLFNNKEVIQKDYLKKWLFKVAINETKNHLRSNWIKKVYKSTDDILNIRGKENDKEIIELLKSIPKKYRIVIHLYYFEGYNIKEIASILNVNLNTIKTWLKRAKEKIKIEMGE